MTELRFKRQQLAGSEAISLGDKAHLNIAIAKAAISADGGERYCRRYEHFLQFIIHCGLQNDTPMDQLRAYAFECAERVSTETVLSYLSMIKTEGSRRDPRFLSSRHEEREYSALFKTLKRVFGREDSAKKTEKTPMSEKDLLLLAEIAKKELASDPSFPDLGKVVAATMVVMFGGLLRATELMGPKLSRAKWKNVTFHHAEVNGALCRFAKLWLPIRKTYLSNSKVRADSSGRASDGRVIEFTNSFPGNPVDGLEFLVSRAKATGYPYLVPERLNLKANSFYAIFSRITREAGLAGKYTPHCFRHGGATFLASLNVSEEVIKRRGGWSSRAFEVYVHHEPSSEISRQSIEDALKVRCSNGYL